MWQEVCISRLRFINESDLAFYGLCLNKVYITVNSQAFHLIRSVGMEKSN